MSDAVLPRPGAVFGAYPEREDDRVGTLDKAMANAAGWLRQRLARGRVSAPIFLRMARSQERRISDLDAAGWQRELAELRRALRASDAPPLRLVARSFAMIRIAAQRTKGLRPYDVQLLGGLVMLRGAIAEMETGEGKTLTAVLPAATAALAGTPVHIITVNDFLATRDAEWMSPIYRSLGLSVGVIVEGLSPEERRRAYACDIVYGTNKQMAFDYLKDRIALGDETRPLHLAVQPITEATPRSANLVMRGLCFAIVDEADSCLVDEARTPLIISRAGDMTDLARTYRHAIDLARALEAPRDYVINHAEHRVRLTDLGKARVRKLSESWGGVWAAEVHRHELIRQALTALHIHLRDTHYIVRDGRIAIVDEYTGRIMADRSWERGLHQMIEVKEGLEITGSQETLARISYQRFFGRYLHLSGMTGTAREVAGELWSVYGLRVRRVQPNRRSRRRDLGAEIYLTEAAKDRAVVRRVKKLQAKGRPVLIGTRSVAASERISGLLTKEGLPHALLNARQDQQEAEIVARAGRKGAITVATNMAGRGTDIALGDGVEAAGGLFVIATEPHDARRIDRQLYGRCARQGDRGAHLMMASLEDEMVRQTFSSRIVTLARPTAVWRGRVPGMPFRALVRIAQRAAERRNAQARRMLLRHDDSMEDMLAFAGRT